MSRELRAKIEISIVAVVNGKNGPAERRSFGAFVELGDDDDVAAARESLMRSLQEAASLQLPQLCDDLGSSASKEDQRGEHAIAPAEPPANTAEPVQTRPAVGGRRGKRPKKGGPPDEQASA